MQQMKKCSAIKNKAKLLFKNIDQGGTGLVKEDVFFDILKLHAIEISS
jgi:Ca2+-binding EF-hand superfamily protein